MSDLRKAAQDVVDAKDFGYTTQNNLNHRIDALRAALQQPAPDDAVCEWGKDKDGDYVATCHKVIWAVEDEDDEPQGWLTYCYGCGKRIRFIDGENNGA